MQVKRLSKIFIPISLILTLLGCSNTKLLTLFFDGVPSPVQPAVVAQVKDNGAADSTATDPASSALLKKPYYYHSPYENRECASCHDKSSMGKLLQPLPGLCYQCHDDFTTVYKVLHGPVEGGECTACHSPHMAENEKLILQKGQQLCLSCHDSTEMFAVDSHKEMGTKACYSCHNPHGGDKRYFIK
jgi:predicted CXXCH cytochrome family protein